MTGLAAKRSFPSKQQTKQPYKVTLPEEAKRPESLTTELQFMGHYKEQNIKFDVDLAELANAGGKLVYEMVFDSPTGKWEIVVVQDEHSNPIGVAEFTQSPAPAN